jgi:hypothetical protein
MISSVPMDSQKALRFGICGKNCMRQNELDYALETTLVDAGPTLAMAALGANVQQLKDALQALARQPLMQADIVRHMDLTNRAAFSLVQACLEAGVQPGLIANVFLYYWLRASTINANVPEPFFQTLKRHWDTVVERVAAFVDTLGHRAQP